MYGIKSAVRRLDFAPDIKDMQVIDVKKGRFVFRPRPGKPVSLADLQKSVTKAGYQIERARISVRGTLAPTASCASPRPARSSSWSASASQASRRAPP